VSEYQQVEKSRLLERELHDALLAVLDALIELDGAPSAKEVRTLFPEFSAQSIILLVRSPNDAQPELLDIFQNAKANWTWLAAGNVLLNSRAPGFVAVVLRKFTQHMIVSVIDPGIGSGSAGGGSECGFSSRAPKTGWPPVGLYQLTQFPERMPQLRATLLVRGETSVYYWRVEPGNYDNPSDALGGCDDGNRDLYRAQYLNKLAESSFPRISLDAYPRASIEWHGASSYEERVIAAVEEQRKLFNRAVVYLRDSDRSLTATEAAPLKPRLEIEIRDERTDRSAPLPAVLGNSEDVAVVTIFSKPLY
jgi:hypothetical protein